MDVKNLFHWKCSFAVLTLTVNNLTTVDQQKQTGCICCDVTEVFDCVSHIILQGKLYYYDTYGVNSHWLQSYTANKKQRFEIILKNHEHLLPNGEQYIWMFPRNNPETFFLLDINNLPPRMQSYSKTLLLTDGTIVLITDNNVEDLKMRSAPVLNGVSKWFLVIGLSLNILKTNVMKFIHFQDDSFLHFHIDKQLKK